MIQYTQGNLLASQAEAVVNTVNTVGVMGKGIALMFKEAFKANFLAYQEACRHGEVEVGRMFVTERIGRPRWIVNFPTKKHWRHPSKLSWVVEGLEDLRRVIEDRQIRSIALPPLGCGSGGLRWNDVRQEIERALGDLTQVDVLVYAPTEEYQNRPKEAGLAELTPARALIVELIRRYSVVLGLGSSMIEIQKLTWFLDREILATNLPDPLKLRFEPGIYGPYAQSLKHLLDGLDGGFLQSPKRIPDTKPLDEIYFVQSRKQEVVEYLQSSAGQYLGVLEETAKRIDGFESPLGLELLATVDWLLSRENRQPEVADIKEGLGRWRGPSGSAERKLRLFDDRLIGIALERLAPTSPATT